jgi:hypothetical protein
MSDVLLTVQQFIFFELNYILCGHLDWGVGVVEVLIFTLRTAGICNIHINKYLITLTQMFSYSLSEQQSSYVTFT